MSDPTALYAMIVFLIIVLGIGAVLPTLFLIVGGLREYFRRPVE